MNAVILGAGPGGLSSAYFLARAGVKPVVIEKQDFVGGISRTKLTPDGFRYDMGGHRFFTKNRVLLEMVAEILGDDLLMPVRVSRIYKEGKFFLYPIKIGDVLRKLSVFRGAGFLLDYIWAKTAYSHKPDVSFEDWVVKRFGRGLYRFNFEEYTEKVWGLKPTEISADWAAERIRGLSLTTALKEALFPKKEKGAELATIIDRFYYPRYGIGEISERFADFIKEKGGRVVLNAPVQEIRWKDRRIISVAAGNEEFMVDHTIGSIPLPAMLAAMRPSPPKEVMTAAEKLRFRDLLIVFLKIAKPNVTSDSWIYFPELRVPFGRWHEPKNWSRWMVPDDSVTSLPVEYFVFRGDGVWRSEDKALADGTVDFIEREFGFISKKDVMGWEVTRVPEAYPVWDLGYREPLSVVLSWLEGFENLYLIGRNGRHRYNLMDHSFETGILAAKSIVDGVRYNMDDIDWGKGYLEAGEIPVIKRG
ncbi:MAG: FAD-dependent oxidoreductase [candidate division WOR-3 bacterium]